MIKERQSSYASAKSRYYTWAFLLASLKHYLADVWDRERAIKRGGKHEFVFLDQEIEAAENLYAGDERAATLDEEQRMNNAGRLLCSGVR